MHTEGQVSPLANSILHSQIFNHFLGSQERHMERVTGAERAQNGTTD